MSCNLFPDSYEDLIQENIVWILEATKHITHALERDHIILVMNDSARVYRDRGYQAAMKNRR